MGRLSREFPTAQAVDAALKRANKAEVDVIDLTTEMGGKVDNSDFQMKTQNLQGQINQIVISSSAEAVVAPEVAAARVDFDGTEYETLKGRLDADNNNTLGGLNVAINNSNVAEICNSDANNLPNDQVYSVGFTSLTDIFNFPDSKGIICTFGRSKKYRYNGDIQCFTTYQGKLLLRIYWSNSWQEWVTITDEKDIESMIPAYSHYVGVINDSTIYDVCENDADNLENNKAYGLGISEAEATHFPTNIGFIVTYGADDARRNGDVQIHFNSTGTIRTRIYWSNQWTEWKLIINEDYIKNREQIYVLGANENITNANVAEICDSDADNLPNNRIYGLGMSSAVVHFPQTTGCIMTFGKTGSRTNGDVQVHISAVNTIRTRVYWGNVWGDWILNVNDTYIKNREQVYVLGTNENITNDTADAICHSDFDRIPNNRVYGVGLTSSIQNAPALKGNITTFGKSSTRTSGDVQVFTEFTGIRYSRLYWGSAWTEWRVAGGSDPTTSIRILALGDSICYGVRNGNKGFVGDLGLPYNNIGVSGATLSTRVTNVKNIPQQLVDYVPTNQPDVIISNGGVNDYYFSAPLGTVPTVPVTNDTDAEALSRDTIIGGLQYLLYKMISLYPKAQRFFLLTHKTTAKASNVDSTIVDWTVTTNSAGYTQRQLFEAIKTTCEIYGVKVINVFGDSMINTAFSQCKSPTPYSSDPSVTNTEFVDSDGIHPLAYGYKRGYVPFVKQAIFGAEPR